MKTRYIEAALRAKFLDWQASIQDESVKALVAQNTIITGGCITSMLLDEKVNDYDFYFSDAETVRAVARYYIKQYKVNPSSPREDE